MGHAALYNLPISTLRVTELMSGRGMKLYYYYSTSSSIVFCPIIGDPTFFSCATANKSGLNIEEGPFIQGACKLDAVY